MASLVSSKLNGSIQPTYEELKPGDGRYSTAPLSRIQPTYEELKHKHSSNFSIINISIQPTYEELKLSSIG